jgi:Protein of unknown function (DUF4232)
MADVEDRLRETLRRRAGSVPARLDVPPGLVGRARSRIARNAVAGVALIAVVAVGSITGVRALTGPSQGRVVTTPPAPTCRGVDLSGSSHLMTPEGKGEVREGSLSLINVGAAACSLRGKPIVRVLNYKGEELLRGVSDLEPEWRASGKGSPPPDWPVVTLLPGDKAKIHVSWENWCGGSQEVDPRAWEVLLPGGAGKMTPFPVIIRQDVPTCARNGEGSTLNVGPFEPYVP